jgi:hypothetical protein
MWLYAKLSIFIDRLLQICQAQDINILNLLPLIGRRITIIFRTTTTMFNTLDILTLIRLIHSNLFRYVQVLGVNLFLQLSFRTCCPDINILVSRRTEENSPETRRTFSSASHRIPCFVPEHIEDHFENLFRLLVHPPTLASITYITTMHTSL